MHRDDSGVPEIFSAESELGPYVGPEVGSREYEVLCRYALSREYGIPLHVIKSGHLQGPSKATRHQIDLYWTSNDGVCEFLCIANAKFKKKNVSLTDIMTLLGVQQAVRAHKAMIITNSGFSEACVAQAKENGVALLIVRPAGDLDPGVLPTGVSGAAAGELERRLNQRITPAYRMDVVHKGLEGKAEGGSWRGGEGEKGGNGGGWVVFGGIEGGGGADGPVAGSARAGSPPSRPAQAVSIPNKMMSSPAARSAGPFGISRK